MKCFYHRSDLDGKCSAAIVLHKFPEIKLIGIDYGDEFPWKDIKPGEDIYMIDFCIQPYEDMYKLQEISNLIWIDHHKKAIENFYPNPNNGIQRDGTAACILIWEYCFPKIELPLGVRLLGEYDVWNHSDERTEPFQYGMQSLDDEPNSHIWYYIFQNDISEVNSIIRDGSIILRYVEKDFAGRAKSLCFEVEFEGLKLIAANFSGNSKFFDSIYDNNRHDAMCLFYWRPKDKKWVVSLYSTKEDIDVSEIADKYGGGGHKGACGFSISELPFIKKDLEKVSFSLPHYRLGK